MESANTMITARRAAPRKAAPKRGNFLVRMSAELHQQLDDEARRAGMSMNALCVTKLSLPLGRSK